MPRKQLGRAAAAATDLMTRGDVLGLYTFSLAANGYQKLPSGLIIQWGAATPSGGTATITFPIAFPVACTSIVSSPIIAGAGTGATYNSFNLTMSLTGCTIAVRVQTGLTTGASTAPVQWQAVGY